jgi:hypothetical protein
MIRKPFRVRRYCRPGHAAVSASREYVLQQHIWQLRCRVLGCRCRNHEECHADILI